MRNYMKGYWAFTPITGREMIETDPARITRLGDKVVRLDILTEAEFNAIWEASCAR